MREPDQDVRVEEDQSRIPNSASHGPSYAGAVRSSSPE
jgi:hypothetical protein